MHLIGAEDTGKKSTGILTAKMDLKRLSKTL